MNQSLSAQFFVFSADLPLIKRRGPAVEIAGIPIVPRLSWALRMASPNLLICTDLFIQSHENRKDKVCQRTVNETERTP